MTNNSSELLVRKLLWMHTCRGSVDTTLKRLGNSCCPGDPARRGIFFCGTASADKGRLDCPVSNLKPLGTDGHNFPPRHGARWRPLQRLSKEVHHGDDTPPRHAMPQPGDRWSMPRRSAGPALESSSRAIQIPCRANPG